MLAFVDATDSPGDPLPVLMPVVELTVAEVS